MPTVTIDTGQETIKLEIDSKRDLATCLVPALIAAMPAFLDSYVKCITTGGGPPGEYKPGDRPRC